MQFVAPIESEADKQLNKYKNFRFFVFFSYCKLIGINIRNWDKKIKAKNKGQL